MGAEEWVEFDRKAFYRSVPRIIQYLRNSFVTSSPTRAATSAASPPAASLAHGTPEAPVPKAAPADAAPSSALLPEDVAILLKDRMGDRPLTVKYEDMARELGATADAVKRAVALLKERDGYDAEFGTTFARVSFPSTIRIRRG
jgi:hypothetical protein